jgi:carboxyl-terminal processing protease
MAASDQETNEVRELSSVHVSGITEEELAGKNMDEMLAMLKDPYTTYFTADEMKQFLDLIENSFVGIGVRIGQDDTGIYISEVFPDMPAELAGLRRDDYLTSVNGNSIQGMTTADVVDLILGEENTRVEVTVQRGSESLTISVQRGVIQVPIIEAKRFGNVGYIALSSFSDKGDKLFTKALNQMQKDGIEGLIIDLRNNGGGYIDTALNIGANFIKQGVFLHTSDRNHKDIPSVIENGKTFDKPVYILMNEASASASEALAGALRDSAGAKLIGTQSFGKGSMQYMLNLSDGGVLKVTTVEYLTPKNTKVNHVGLEPDIEVYGDMPQLITALHAAGEKDLRIAFNTHHVSINEVEVNGAFPVKQEKGSLYLPSRLLAALVGADIEWKGKENEIVISQGAQKHTFAIATDIALKSGSITYINIEVFAKAFQAIHWTSSDDTWIIEASK